MFFWAFCCIEQNLTTVSLQCLVHRQVTGCSKSSKFNIICLQTMIKERSQTGKKHKKSLKCCCFFYSSENWYYFYAKVIFSQAFRACTNLCTPGFLLMSIWQMQDKITSNRHGVMDDGFILIFQNFKIIFHL